MKSKSVKTKTLLSIEDLSVTLYTDKVTVCPVNTVNYTVESGKVLAIVGESGSGKTVMNMAPLGLLPQGVTADVEGSVLFEGKNLIESGTSYWSTDFRGNRTPSWPLYFCCTKTGC
jgi:peptide/nickel transport system ATP-binding protein